MAATVSPRFRAVSGDQKSRSIGYIVRGATDDNDALDALESETPLTYDGMPRTNIAIDEIDFNNGDFYATATYTRTSRQPPATSAVEYSFDVSVGSVKIVQSNSTVERYTSSGSVTGGATDATDFQKAIAVDADGVPQGVDIQIPRSSFEVRYYPANATVTTAYQKQVRDLVGTVNNATFNGHAAGEVLFIGCSGSKRSDADWELSYRFEVQPNQTGISIGDITGIAVNGWDVLWVYYKQDTDSNTKRYIQKPKQVNIERVYERTNFGLLGLGL